MPSSAMVGPFPVLYPGRIERCLWTTAPGPGPISGRHGHASGPEPREFARSGNYLPIGRFYAPALF